MISSMVRNVPDWVAALVTAGLILLIVLELFVLYQIFRWDHRRILWYQLAANITIGHMPLAFFVYPGDIHIQLLKKGLSVGYCMFSIHIHFICEMAAPWLLFLFSVERLMYIRDPTGHAQRISRAGAITLLAFPWVFGTIMTLVSIHPSGEAWVEDWGSVNDTQPLHICSLDQWTPVGYFIVETLAIGFPFFVSFIITITVLIMWCCYKRKHSMGRDYSMMGDEVVENVRSSVIAVVVLNALAFSLFLVDQIIFRRLYIDFIFDGMLHVAECVIWMTTLPKVRAKVVALFRSCCCKGRPEVPTTVTYKANEQVSVEPEN